MGIDSKPATVLTAVLCNPPASGGARTLARVELATELLGFGHVTVTNLFGLPTASCVDVAQVGKSAEAWLAARTEIGLALGNSDGVLLAYGLVPPTGSARKHHREQVNWVRAELRRADLPVWWVGGGPRHPSRWQRWTSRFHAELDFQGALAASLSKVTI